jgi:hypothetical protein
MNTDIQSSLIRLGYKLQDYGNHWRTNAIYRGGDNSVALKIYKDTGVWTDFVENRSPMPFVKLVQLTLNTNDPNVLKDYTTDSVKNVEYKPKETLQMERIYPEDCLKKLFPNFSFYEKRSISKEVQSMYKCGLASSGKMYRRMVFPIYNKDGQIFGFSGRKVDEDNDAPKWKHIGLKSNWVYPAIIPNFKEIDNEVILVESIGDSMALTHNGFSNNLVTFGLDCSNALVNFLISLNLNSIIIATNNDSDKEKNRGLIAAIKIMAKLSNFFDIDLLKIKLPIRNDFAEMQNSDNPLLFQEWFKRKELSSREILDIISQNENDFNKSKIKKLVQKLKIQNE